MTRIKCFLSLILVFTLMFSLNVSASSANVYTVQYLDKATNQAIVPPVINVFSPSSAFNVTGQVNYNGYQLDSVSVNGQAATHANGAVTVQNPTASSYSIIYFYNDKEAPKATIKQYAFFEQNGDNDPAEILANLYDNSGITNISLKYTGAPPDTSIAGTQNVEIELSDRTGNKSVLKGEVAVVGKARYTASFKDSATGKNVRDTIVAPLTVGENKSIQFSFPAGYELITASVDGTEQKSGTIAINNADERNYNVVFTLKDVVSPTIKVVGPSSFQRGDDVDLEQIFIAADNSDEPVSLTGNVGTSKVGTFNTPITARDATGNYTTVNFNYTVYGTNTYTIQYTNKQNNQDLLPRSEAVQFSTKDSVTIIVPVLHNGFTLTDIDLGINQSKAAIDLKNGRVTLTNLTDASFVCKAVYLDTTKPIGTARTDNKVKKNAQVNAMQCLAYVYDNTGIDGLTAYFSGSAPETGTAGTKNAIVLLKDAAGNVSDPINVTITVEGEDDFTIKIRYIDNDTDRVVKTDTITREKGAVISRGDLSIPSGYQLVNKSFSFNVTKDATVDVDVTKTQGDSADDGEFALTIKYVDWEKVSAVIGTQTIPADYGRIIEAANLKLPEGYELYTSFSRYRVYNDSTLTVKVKKAAPKEISIAYMNGTQKVGSQTLKDFTGDSVSTSAFILPNGYSLDDPTKTSYTPAETISVAVKQNTVSVYIVRQSRSDEHSDIAVPGKSNNFKILLTYKNSDGANTSPYTAVIDVVTDTKNGVWYYIVDDSEKVETNYNQNPIGSSIKAEITDGFVYFTTYPEGQHTSYIVGYDEGGRRVFGPDRALTRAEFSTLIYRNFIEPFKDGIYTESSFEDVSPDAWYFQPVEAMKQLYIVNGYEEYVNGAMKRLFKPDQPITRAEAATLLSRIRNIKPQYVQASYNDIPEEAWYRSYVNQSASLGYFRYVEGAFNPLAPMTRGETIFAFNVAMDRKPFQAADYRNPFEDLSPTHPYYADIMEATINHDYVTDGDTEKRPGN